MPFITCTSGVSLRLIDWFVTNYAKKHNIILTKYSGHNVVHFNVYLSYRAQLKAYSKQQFDPFRRRDRVVFYYDRNSSVETTIGQLNFFRWMLQHEILDFVTSNAPAIERDMLSSQRSASQDEGHGSRDKYEGHESHEGHERSRRPALQSPSKSAADAQRRRPTKSSAAAPRSSTPKKKRAELSQCKATMNMTRLLGSRTVNFD
jgi:hypothetical protein